MKYIWGFIVLKVLGKHWPQISDHVEWFFTNFWWVILLLLILVVIGWVIEWKEKQNKRMVKKMGFGSCFARKESVDGAARTSSGIEKQLEDQYISMFQMTMGMSPSQAKSTFRDLIKKAKEESVKEGSSKFPQNFGAIILQEESTNPHYRSFLTRKRSEGVRDEDIKWWWNMHDLEKRMMVEVDNWMGFSLFLKLKEDGLNEDEAGEKVKKSRPIFGDPDDAHVTGEDRPLPHELRNRINIYVEKRLQTDPEKLKKEIEESSTFNALIRKEIKKGNI